MWNSVLSPDLDPPSEWQIPSPLPTLLGGALRTERGNISACRWNSGGGRKVICGIRRLEEDVRRKRKFSYEREMRFQPLLYFFNEIVLLL